jgi:hypothetical protein
MPDSEHPADTGKVDMTNVKYKMSSFSTYSQLAVSIGNLQIGTKILLSRSMSCFFSEQTSNCVRRCHISNLP